MPNSPIPSSLIQSLGSAFGGSTTPAASPQPTPTPPPAGGPGVGSSLMDMFKNYGQSKEMLDEDDFTQPGEMIPQNAGIGDFLKYNVAHFNPRSPENMMGMAGSVGGIGKATGSLSNMLSKLAPEAEAAAGPTMGKAAQGLLEHQQARGLNLGVNPNAPQNFGKVIKVGNPSAPTNFGKVIKVGQ